MVEAMIKTDEEFHRPIREGRELTIVEPLVQKVCAGITDHGVFQRVTEIGRAHV